MTPEQFRAWRAGRRLSRQAAADELGISSGSVELYELGRRKDDGRPVVIPKTIALACAALSAGLKPWGED